jgi:hypothetical protein
MKSWQRSVHTFKHIDTKTHIDEALHQCRNKNKMTTFHIFSKSELRDVDRWGYQLTSIADFIYKETLNMELTMMWENCNFGLVDNFGAHNVSYGTVRLDVVLRGCCTLPYWYYLLYFTMAKSVLPWQIWLLPSNIPSLLNAEPKTL